MTAAAPSTVASRLAARSGSASTTIDPSARASAAARATSVLRTHPSWRAPGAGSLGSPARDGAGSPRLGTPRLLASDRPRSNVASAIVWSGNDQANAYFLGEDGLVRWSATHAEAWVGFLETHKRLTRALDAELDGRHGLSLSATEVLGRLAATEDRCMRLSQLATATGLSLSRISRIVDSLAKRGLVIRKGREDDARAV